MSSRSAIRKRGANSSSVKDLGFRAYRVILTVALNLSVMEKRNDSDPARTFL